MSLLINAHRFELQGCNPPQTLTNFTIMLQFSIHNLTISLIFTYAFMQYSVIVVHVCCCFQPTSSRGTTPVLDSRSTMPSVSTPSISRCEEVIKDPCQSGSLNEVVDVDRESLQGYKCIIGHVNFSCTL